MDKDRDGEWGFDCVAGGVSWNVPFFALPPN